MATSALGRSHREALPLYRALADANPQNPTFARIVQVLENLLHNASKYTPDGGSIRIAAHVVDDSVEIEVSDDGIGIASSDLERIFEPFTQLEPAAVRASGGLGIGLALVRRLVELHGGSVAVFSEGIGRGARFTVRLPRSHPGV